MRKTLLAALAVSGLVPTVANAQSGLEARSAAIAERYLAVWSAGGSESVADVPYIYGPRVRFFGRNYSQAQLAAEKRRAIQRWPERSYQHRPGSMRVTCNAEAAKCAVQSVVDYRAANPATGRSARGATTFELGISYAGARPVILYESGRNLPRGS